MALPPLLVGAYTLLQLRTPGELQGRAFSAFDLIASVPQTISIAVGALLIGTLGYRGEMSIIAVVVAVSAFMLLLPIEGEPNFGPGKDAAALEEGVDLHGDEQIASS
jgi:MFS family permease